jgi:hypothetical protein
MLETCLMWQIESSEQYLKDLAWYGKKRPAELAAVLNNLVRYRTQLLTAKNAKCIQGGYIHTEGKGVLALDESAGGKNLQATRLYLYSHEPAHTVHLIAIGNKDTQPGDVKFCHEYVEHNFLPPQ